MKLFPQDTCSITVYWERVEKNEIIEGVDEYEKLYPDQESKSIHSSFGDSINPNSFAPQI